MSESTKRRVKAREVFQPTDLIICGCGCGNLYPRYMDGGFVLQSTTNGGKWQFGDLVRVTVERLAAKERAK